MARIVGVDLPKNKRGEIGRTAFALDFDTQISDRRTDRTDLVVRPILDFEVVADASDLENLAGRKKTVANKKKATK